MSGTCHPPLNLCKEIQEGGCCVCECVGVCECLLMSATLANINYFAVPSYSANGYLYTDVIKDRLSVNTFAMCTTIT